MELNLIELLEYIKENDIQNAVFESKDTYVKGKVCVSYGIIKIEDAVIDDIFEVEEKITEDTILDSILFVGFSNTTNMYHMFQTSYRTIRDMTSKGHKDVTIYCFDDKTGELVLVYKDGDIVNE